MPRRRRRCARRSWRRLTGDAGQDRDAATGDETPRAPRRANRDLAAGASLARRSFWTGAFSGIGGTAIAAAIAFFLVLPIWSVRLSNEIVSAHVRSLMPAHLIDVVSTDKHTVKPWFAGHADVSPVVADFEAQGYRLIGGRADYIDHQRSAVVVYQHGAHVINVFTLGRERCAFAQRHDAQRLSPGVSGNRAISSTARCPIPAGTSSWGWCGCCANSPSALQGADPGGTKMATPWPVFL